MSSGSLTLLNIKEHYADKGESEVIQLLENNQDLTFNQIAEMTGFKLSKVYQMNAVLDPEPFISGGKNKKDCIERRLQVVEPLYKEGFNQVQIASMLGVGNNTISLDIRKIKQRRENNEK